MSDYKQEESQDGLRLPPEVEEACLLTKYSRPEEPISLLADSGNRDQQVQIGGGDCDFETYCHGFLRAANVVVDSIIQPRMQGKWSDYSTFGESPAYAALFLYRHHLELRLKEMIVACGGTPQKVHLLADLWRQLRRIDKLDSDELTDESRQDLHVVEQVITQLDHIDSNSLVFRYPVDKDRKPTLPRMCINLVQLKKALGWLGKFLEGWSTGIYETRQAEMEYRDCEP